MTSNFIWMALSTVTRLGAGFLAFVLIARALGPDEFGHYMYWFGVTYLGALLPNFGLATLLLREISIEPASAKRLLSTALSARLAMSALVVLCALILAPIVDRPVLFAFLLTATLFEIISETLFVGLRAIGEYAAETRIAAWVAVVQLTSIAAVALTIENAEVIALTYLCGRVFQFVVIWVVANGKIGSLTVASVRAGTDLIKRSSNYAVDFGLSNLFGNIDSIFLRALVGIEAVGLFQSGMRLFQGGAQAAPLLANVFLPAVAKNAAAHTDNSRPTRVLQYAFLASGACFGLAMAYLSTPIVNLLFGARFSGLAELLPLFGVLFFSRFFAASWGLVLTAAGEQTYRAWATASHLAVLAACGPILASRFGIKGWLVALVVSNIFLGIVYMVKAIRAHQSSASPFVALATVAGGLAFIPRLI